MPDCEHHQQSNFQILENDAERGEVGGTADEVAKGVNKRRVQMNYNEGILEKKNFFFF